MGKVEREDVVSNWCIKLQQRAVSWNDRSVLEFLLEWNVDVAAKPQKHTSTLFGPTETCQEYPMDLQNNYRRSVEDNKEVLQLKILIFAHRRCGKHQRSEINIIEQTLQ